MLTCFSSFSFCYFDAKKEVLFFSKKGNPCVSRLYTCKHSQTHKSSLMANDGRIVQKNQRNKCFRLVESLLTLSNQKKKEIKKVYWHLSFRTCLNRVMPAGQIELMSLIRNVVGLVVNTPFPISPRRNTQRIASVTT